MKLPLVLIFGFLGAATAQEAALLPTEQRSNGAATLDALSMIQSTTKRCVAQVLDDKGNAVQLAIIVSEDGYVLTKASEAPSQDHFKLAWFDGRRTEASVLVIDRSLDLLLAHTQRNDTMPISWSDAKDFRIGTWMCAFDQGKPKSPSLPLRLGNISAHRRGIRGGAALGVEMANDAPSEAVRIIDLGVESPAEKAGLQRNDLILAIDDVRVTSIDILRVELDQHAAGDRVKLGVRREKEERSIEVRLGSHSTVTSNWTGEDYANGGVSLRTDNFADIIQHQMPLSPRDMGGPLLDLDGRAVGINIARADRVTTFALPVSAFWGKVQEWIVQARKAGHEEVRSAEVVEDK